MQANPIIVREPSECSDAELLAVIATVAKGAEVQEHYVRQGVKNARALLWIATSREVVAVAAIKNPHETYRRSVFQKAGVKERADEFFLELGYIYVDPAHRRQGYGLSLVDHAMKVVRGETMYATTRLDNEKMQRILERWSFARVGKPYPSTDDPAKSLCLYVRPATG